MKKRILLFTATLALVYLSVSSYQDGAASTGYDCTGNGMNAYVLNSCGTSGCHGTGAGPALTIDLDSAGTTVHQYYPGKSYTIQINGTGTTNSWFGFQVCVLQDTGAAQTDAGTMAIVDATTTKFVSATPPYNPATIVEQRQPIQSIAGSFYTSVSWTAPAQGTGTVKIYAALCAVNHDSLANAGDSSSNLFVSIPEAPNVASVNRLPANIGIKAYPNPCSSQFRLQMNNADAGTYIVKAYDMSGRCLINENLEVNSNSYETNINTANWAPGFYGVQIIKDGAQRVIPIIKQ